MKKKKKNLVKLEQYFGSEKCTKKKKKCILLKTEEISLSRKNGLIHRYQCKKDTQK